MAFIALLEHLPLISSCFRASNRANGIFNVKVVLRRAGRQQLTTPENCMHNLAIL
jgi:hypothetical protein